MPRAWRPLGLLLPALVAFGAQPHPFPGLAQRGAYDTAKALTERFPRRLAGSADDHGAHAWALEQLKALGLEVRQEAFPLPRTWTRGAASVRFQGTTLKVAQLAWTPALPSPLRAPLVRVATLKDLEALPRDLQGAVVLAGAPATRLDPPQMQPPLRLGAPPPPPDGRLPLHRLAQRLQGRNAAAVLVDAGKSGGRLDMDALFLAPFPGELPMAVVAHEDYGRLWGHSGPEVVELELGGAFGPPGHSFNTLAEWRGRERPGEWVLVGAHLDAFDLGTGATDNAAGAAAVLEAARLLKAAGRPPRRSLRFVLFGGEEQGFLGAQAYVAAHQEELARASAVLVLDTGAGAVDGVALQGRTDLLPLFQRLTAPLRPLGVTETDLRREGGTDHLPFEQAGVPAFCLEQVQHGYARDHHSEADTLDAMDPAEVQQCAVVLAHLARGIAELKRSLPRRPSEP